MLFGRLRDLINYRLTALLKPIARSFCYAKGVFDCAFESLINQHQLKLCDAFSPLF
jgi:hypothetical protein